MSPLHFRLAVGLANAVEGAAIQVRFHDGGAIVASGHPWSAVNLGDLRSALLARGKPTAPSDRLGDIPIDRRVAEVEVAGSLVHLGAGLHLLEEFEEDLPPTLWFSIPLGPRLTAAVLADAGIDDELDDEAEITLRPDPNLGVTAVGVKVDGEDEVFDLALRCHAACLAAELETMTLAPINQRDNTD